MMNERDGIDLYIGSYGCSIAWKREVLISVGFWVKRFPLRRADSHFSQRLSLSAVQNEPRSHGNAVDQR